LRDLLGESCILLVEWPEKGRGVLPPADLRLGLTFPGSGRALSLEAASPEGGAILEMLDTSS
jgi:tRNA threonylcarbamoyladenosine biosynthesis protein TsaE